MRSIWLLIVAQIQPDRKWEVDLKTLETLVDSKTRAILVNNPRFIRVEYLFLNVRLCSNPAGSNYTKQHLLEILAFAEKHRLPIISDEMYGEPNKLVTLYFEFTRQIAANMVFKGESFHAMAELTSEVPILTMGGVAKQFLMPGWRVGWILVQDRHNRLKAVREALNSISQLILGASSVVQAVLPDLLHTTKPEFFTKLNATLEEQAMFFVDRIKRIPQLNVIVPQGAMYLMVSAAWRDNFANEVDFCRLASRLTSSKTSLMTQTSRRNCSKKSWCACP